MPLVVSESILNFIVPDSSVTDPRIPAGWVETVTLSATSSVYRMLGYMLGTSSVPQSQSAGIYTVDEVWGTLSIAVNSWAVAVPKDPVAARAEMQKEERDNCEIFMIMNE